MIRTRSELNADFADNDQGLIDADDLRNLVESIDLTTEVNAKLSSKASTASVGAHTVQITALTEDVANLTLEVEGHADELDALAGRADSVDASLSGLAEGLDLQGNSIGDLAGQLATKASTSSLNTLATNTSTALAGKANVTHTHTIGDITDLSTQLAGKASTSHTHSQFANYLPLAGGTMTGDLVVGGNLYATTLDIGGSLQIDENGNITMPGGGATLNVNTGNITGAIQITANDLYVSSYAELPYTYFNGNDIDGIGYVYSSGVSTGELNAGNAAINGTMKVGYQTPGAVGNLNVVGQNGSDATVFICGGAGGTKANLYLGNRDNTNGNIYGAWRFDNGTNDFLVWNNYAQGDFGLGAGTRSKDIFISRNGNVAIGYSSPTYLTPQAKLDVGGNTIINGTLRVATNFGTGTSSGTIQIGDGSLTKSFGGYWGFTGGIYSTGGNIFDTLTCTAGIGTNYINVGGGGAYANIGGNLNVSGTTTLGGPTSVNNNLFANGYLYTETTAGSYHEAWYDEGYAINFDGTSYSPFVIASQVYGDVMRFESGGTTFDQDVSFSNTTTHNGGLRSYGPVSMHASYNCVAKGSSLSVAGTGFNTLALSATSDPGGNWSNTNRWYTVPVSGTYQIVAKMRLNDGTAGGISYSIFMHTSNVDFEALWTTTNANREGVQNVRVDHFNAGDQIRMYTYIGVGGTYTGITASMAITLLTAD